MQAAVLDPFNASYSSGTACHLDLVQWATKPIWGELSLNQRAKLLVDDAEFLAHQLKTGSSSIILMNGQQVVSQLTSAGIVETEIAYKSSYPTKAGEVSYTVYTGRSPSAPEPLFLGWSFYVQNMRITLEAHKSIISSIREKCCLTSCSSQQPRGVGCLLFTFER